MRKSIWPGCKHPETESSSILAKNGDDIAYLRCADPKCMTILEWQIIPKEKDEKPVKEAKKVVEKPATAESETEEAPVAKPATTGRPSKSRPKPVAEKPAAESETPIMHSASFVLTDIRAAGSDAVFVVKNNKGKTFEIVKESTVEKAANVESIKAKYIDVTAIIVKYTTVDADGLPADGIFDQMVNITTE